jgi:hypothetical protein
MSKKLTNIIKIGLPWGVGMFILLALIIPYFNDEKITLKKIVIAFPLWLLGGFVFGYSMNRWLPKEK